jgi:nucleoside-diphosphate-sugar epimerase
MKIALVGAGSSVGRYILSSDFPEFFGIYRSAKALSQLCDLGVGDSLIKVSSDDQMAKAFMGIDAVVTLINDENPHSALLSLKSVVSACDVAKVPQLIHISSASIYGSNPSAAINPNSAGASIGWNSYACGKQWQENFLKGAKLLPPSTVVLRPGLIWGPGMAWLNAPLGELKRGDAWVVEGDAPCNIVNINLLVHAILSMAKMRPKGLSFINIRDSEEYTWAEYYARISQQFDINAKVITVPQTASNSWKSNSGATRSTFPYGLGWSVLPRGLKTVVKRIVKALPKIISHHNLALKDLEHSNLHISREGWELRTARGLPARNTLLSDIQNSYSRTAAQDWQQLDKMRKWIF